jgi:hypothetical protein
MKTTSHLRMFIVVAMITTTACSDPEIVPTSKPPGSGNQISTSEYRATVTTWGREDVGSNYVGLVSSVPNFDLPKATISVVENGKTTMVDPYLNVSRLSRAHRADEAYFWASRENNILLLHFVGQTPSSLPPFPLDVIIVY